MSLAEQALSYVRAISPYQPGKPITELAREMGIPVDSIVKLASNENPLGMSPKARQAVEKAVSGVERYPDQFDLIAKVAERCGVAQNQVVLGNGSNDVLDLVARVFLAPGRSAVFAQHAFAVYPLATLSTGAELIATPAKNYGHDLDAMRAAIRPDTRIVWIANPNNPTGNFLPYPEVRAFLDGLEHFTLAESLGGVESLIAHPASMTHAAMTPEARAVAGISDGLLRLSVGIEAIEDLAADISAALVRAAQAGRQPRAASNTG